MNKEKWIWLLQMFLGVVFILSAISKLIAPGLFEITILDQGIFESREIAAYLGRLLIAMELFIGIAFFQPYYLKRIVLPISLLTLVGFTGLLSYSYFIGDTNNCGCFGEMIKMSPLEAIVKKAITKETNEFKFFFVVVTPSIDSVPRTLVFSNIAKTIVNTSRNGNITSYTPSFSKNINVVLKVDTSPIIYLNLYYTYINVSKVFT